MKQTFIILTMLFSHALLANNNDSHSIVGKMPLVERSELKEVKITRENLSFGPGQWRHQGNLLKLVNDNVSVAVGAKLAHQEFIEEYNGSNHINIDEEEYSEILRQSFVDDNTKSSITIEYFESFYGDHDLQCERNLIERIEIDINGRTLFSEKKVLLEMTPYEGDYLFESSSCAYLGDRIGTNPFGWTGRDWNELSSPTGVGGFSPSDAYDILRKAAAQNIRASFSRRSDGSINLLVYAGSPSEPSHYDQLARLISSLGL